MSTLHRYLLGSFLVTFTASLAVVTFVMCLGVIFKITELLAQGGSGAIVGVFASKLPEALAMTIPMSALTASLLVFGRLSADGEITAMRACGISLWQILRAPVLLSILLMVICFHINSEVAPTAHHQRKELVSQLRSQPLQFFTPGRFVRDLPGLTFYIGKKDGDRIRDVIIYDYRNPDVRREIRAASGWIEISEGGTRAGMHLQDVRIDPFWDGQPGYAEQFTVSDLVVGASGGYEKGPEDMTLSELQDAIASVETHFDSLGPDEVEMQRMALRVERNKRLVLSTFCLGFVVLGVPLGLKGHRKESSIGIAISLGVVLVSYVFIIIAETFAGRPSLRPDLIIWVPVAFSLALGLGLVARAR